MTGLFSLLQNPACFLLFVYFAVNKCECQTSLNYNTIAFYKLHSKLFETGYNQNVRPTLNSSQATVVNVKLDVLSLRDVDMKEQQMKMLVLLEFQWTDELMSWNPNDYEELRAIFIPQKKIWVPDLTVDQYVGDTSLKMGDDSLLLKVGSEGGVTWNPGLTLQTSCAVDIMYYPYDQQVCAWKIYPLMSDTQQIKFDPPLGVDGVYGQDAQQNAEWEIVSVVNETCDFNVSSGMLPDTMSCIKYSFTLQRRSTFLSLTLVTPTLLLALLSALVFSLPAESGEKVSLGVTLMLTFIFLLSILMDVLPGSSLQTSVFMVYLVGLCACSALSVVLTVLVLSLHHRSDSLPLTKPALFFVQCSAGRACVKKNGPVLRKTSVAPIVFVKECCEKGSAGKRAKGDEVVGNGRPEEVVQRSGSAEMTWRDVAAACDFLFSRLFLVVIILATASFCVIMTWPE
ncbi:neuronal acetylcholine receptor subunit beta-3-like [Littorina saxatilis]|uniref:neuronal acetylcholine receptor subunit beta-3-like n=1 Tax=Littorina saxatilis TaxID=31220 RepID=UPI0038B43CBA